MIKSAAQSRGVSGGSAAGLRGESQPIEPDPDHAGGGREMQAPRSDLPDIAADVLDRMRHRRPRVHCITNAVAQTFTANVLLAAGAIPSMTISRKEVANFVARADALLINLGTFDSERQKASLKAIAAANKAGTPWVLDPVFIDRSRPRAAFARTLAGKAPRALRLNEAEFVALTGQVFDQNALARYAKARHTVVGLTGANDFVSNGKRIATIANGHPLMARVTAMGCAGSAVVAACLAVESDPWTATVAALIAFGVAGELAA
jgi:hydroxyethylthiazole kinase